MAKAQTIIAAIGKMSGQPLAAASRDYEKRLRGLNIVEINIRKKLPPLLLQAEESRALIDATMGMIRIAMDPRGQAPSSEGLANQIQSWRQRGQPIAFLIGGADGHTDDLRAVSDHVLSLGPLTLPHLLARVLLLEQLYRAEMITAGHPYHRG